MFKTVLFDVDGVLLSEERYFDASSLTVWELINSKNYVGLDPSRFEANPEESAIRKVRNEVFADNRVLKLMKSRGINANWDMVYLTFSHQLIHLVSQLPGEKRKEAADYLKGELDRNTLQTLGTYFSSEAIHVDFDAFVKDFEKTEVVKQELMLYLNQIAEQKLGISTEAFTRNSTLWDVCRHAFQEWYLGEEVIKETNQQSITQPGKSGFLHDEIPIVKPEEMEQIFETITNSYGEIGIGTGRPKIETEKPLENLGVLHHVQRHRIVTASDVLETEQEYPDQAPLAKPQPFSFVYAWMGRETDTKTVMERSLPIEEGANVLVVGDSVADLMAARAAGFTFAAVLTGLSGEAARKEFEELNADYIFNDVREVQSLF